MPHSFALSFVASFLEDRDVRCVSELSRSVRQELSTAVLWERRFLERPLLKGLWGSHARLLLACGDGLGTQPWYLAKCFAEEPLQVLQSVTARCEMPFVDIPPDAEQIHPIGAVMGGIQQSALHWRHVTALCEKKWRFWWGTTRLEGNEPTVSPLPDECFSAEQLVELVEMVLADDGTWTEEELEMLNALRVRLCARGLFRLLRKTWMFGVALPHTIRRMSFPSWGSLRTAESRLSVPSAERAWLSPAQHVLLDLLEQGMYWPLGQEAPTGSLAWTRIAIALIVQGLFATRPRRILPKVWNDFPEIRGAWHRERMWLRVLFGGEEHPEDPAASQRNAAAARYITTVSRHYTTNNANVPLYAEVTPSGEELGVIGHILPAGRPPPLAIAPPEAVSGVAWREDEDPTLITRMAHLAMQSGLHRLFLEELDAPVFHPVTHVSCCAAVASLLLVPLVPADSPHLEEDALAELRPDPALRRRLAHLRLEPDAHGYVASSYPMHRPHLPAAPLMAMAGMGAPPVLRGRRAHAAAAHWGPAASAFPALAASLRLPLFTFPQAAMGFPTASPSPPQHTFVAPLYPTHHRQHSSPPSPPSPPRLPTAHPGAADFFRAPEEAVPSASAPGWSQSATDFSTLDSPTLLSNPSVSAIFQWAGFVERGDSRDWQEAFPDLAEETNAADDAEAGIERPPRPTPRQGGGGSARGKRDRASMTQQDVEEEPREEQPDTAAPSARRRRHAPDQPLEDKAALLQDMRPAQTTQPPREPLSVTVSSSGPVSGASADCRCGEDCEHGVCHCGPSCSCPGCSVHRRFGLASQGAALSGAPSLGSALRHSWNTWQVDTSLPAAASSNAAASAPAPGRTFSLCGASPPHLHHGGAVSVHILPDSPQQGTAAVHREEEEEGGGGGGGGGGGARGDAGSTPDWDIAEGAGGMGGGEEAWTQSLFGRVLLETMASVSMCAEVPLLRHGVLGETPRSGPMHFQYMWRGRNRALRILVSQRTSFRIDFRYTRVRVLPEGAEPTTDPSEEWEPGAPELVPPERTVRPDELYGVDMVRCGDSVPLDQEVLWMVEGEGMDWLGPFRMVGAYNQRNARWFVRKDLLGVGPGPEIPEEEDDDEEGEEEEEEGDEDGMGEGEEAEDEAAQGGGAERMRDGAQPQQQPARAEQEHQANDRPDPRVRFPALFHYYGYMSAGSILGAFWLRVSETDSRTGVLRYIPAYD